MIMPFGKHKGMDMEEIPSSYLRWLAENCDNPEVCDAADEEYQWRCDHNCHISD